MQNKKKLLYILGGVGLLICVAVLILIFKPFTQTTNNRKFILAENAAPLSSLSIIAHEKGFFKEEGLDIEVRSFTSGKLALDAVVGGAADFGTVAETPIMRAGFANADLKIISTITTTSNDSKVIARKDKGISIFKDLKGKKVATFIGTNAEYFMYSYLKSEGMTVNDIKLTNLQPPDMVAALVRGDIDAYFVWEPHIYNAKKQLGDNAIIFSNKDVYTATFNIIIPSKFAQENPEDAKKFIRALIKAENFAKQNRDEAISIVATQIGMDKSTLSDIWSNYDYQVKLDQSLVEYLKQQATWAIETGSTSNKEMPNYQQMIQPEFLKEIKPEAVTIK